MCGICGIFRRNQRDPSDLARLASMAGMLAHRGPDDFGYLLLDSRSGAFEAGQDVEPRPCDVLLGNRRLSIIDLSAAGRQPMHNETGDIFVVFNGEIFNYLELRGELASRHLFRSNTDTEVIVHAYEEWGQDCVKRFNGMWAFALWDQRRRELFCSRDRFGIKPFYYHLDDGVFIFASEIKAILPALPQPACANEGVLSDYLLDGSLCRSSETFFEGIQRLDPAHNLVISASGTRAIRYWDYPAADQSSDDPRPVEKFRDLLDDAVRLRLRSDVPVGVALSGGVDSTSILGLASRAVNSRPLKAFTAVFPGQPYDERKYAELAAAAHGAELFCIDYQPRDFIEDMREVTWILDYPAIDPQVLPRWQIMRLASHHVKVILEGQGADEMLAGYVPRYFPAYLIDELERIKSGRSAHTLGGLLAGFQEVRRQYARHAYQGLFRQLAPKSFPIRSLRALWESNTVYTSEFKRKNAGRSEPPQARHSKDRLTGLLHFDHAVGILPMLLKFGDALSMACSIESRLPFLDHRLVEFVFRLEARHKLHGTVSKGILREAMAGIIPEQIRSRRDKVGFITPAARWIEQSMDSAVRPILLSSRCASRGIFDVKKMEKMLALPIGDRVRAGYSIFRWISVELWFRLFIDGEGFPPRRVLTTEAQTLSTAAYQSPKSASKAAPKSAPKSVTSVTGKYGP